MAFKISGFGADTREKKEMIPAYETDRQTVIPRKSLVQVRFPGKGIALSYYNDQFDLKKGDLVYVDGKLEGQLGRANGGRTADQCADDGAGNDQGTGFGRAAGEIVGVFDLATGVNSGGRNQPEGHSTAEE